MSIYPHQEDAAARIAAVLGALKTALTGRVVTRDLMPANARAAADLAKGVVTLVSDGEYEYRDGLGLEGLGPRHRMVLVGQGRVADDTARSAAEDAELALLAQVRAFVQTGAARMRLVLVRVQQSRQQTHPYWWLTAEIEARPRP